MRRRLVAALLCSACYQPTAHGGVDVRHESGAAFGQTSLVMLFQSDRDSAVPGAADLRLIIFECASDLCYSTR